MSDKIYAQVFNQTFICENFYENKLVYKYLILIAEKYLKFFRDKQKVNSVYG